VNFSHFVKNIFNQEYSVANSMIFLGKKKSPKIEPKKFPKTIGKKNLPTNMKGCLQFFTLSYFEHSQFG
jgi:hypothetical protein